MALVYFYEAYLSTVSFSIDPLESVMRRPLLILFFIIDESGEKRYEIEYIQVIRINNKRDKKRQ